MGFVLQILSYVFFGALFLFGLLAYFKDRKMYPQYLVLFRLSISCMIVVVTLQIFLAIKFPLSLILWVFFLDVLLSIRHVIKLVGAKDAQSARNHRLLAIIFGVVALVVLIVLGVVSYLLSAVL